MVVSSLQVLYVLLLRVKLARSCLAYRKTKRLSPLERCGPHRRGMK